jgi:hypothetical protein
MADIGTIVGIVGVGVGAGFSYFLYLRHQNHLDKVTNKMDAQAELRSRAHDIALTALNAVQVSGPDNDVSKTAKFHSMQASLTALETTLRDSRTVHDLVSEAVLIGGNELAEKEAETGVHSVWVITPDLEPDLTDDATQKVVKGNIENRVRYCYFCPSTVPDEDIDRLIRDLSFVAPSDEGQSAAIAPTVEKIQVGPELMLFGAGGNRVVIFYDDPGTSRLVVFDEVVLDGRGRGTLWRPRSKDVGKTTVAALRGLTNDGLAK